VQYVALTRAHARGAVIVKNLYLSLPSWLGDAVIYLKLNYFCYPGRGAQDVPI
jgi:hypothetical protein